MKAPSPRLACIALAALAALGFSGCAYQLGSTLPPGLETVRVPVFVNQSGEPQIETETTQAVLEEFQKDGNLRVVSEGGDLTLNVTLSSFKVEPLRYERDQPKATREYRLIITAEVRALREGSQEVFLTRTIRGENTFIVEGDLTTSKQAAMPKAARDLARRIVESLVEYW